MTPPANEKPPTVRQYDEGHKLQTKLLLPDYDTIPRSDSQDCFVQWSETDSELISKFTPKKKRSGLLSQSYSRLGFDSKSNRVSDCGTVLEFAHEIDLNGVVSETAKLHHANFCRDRLCPMCSWRRSYKIFGQVSRIMDSIGTKYKFLFLTLTVPNCSGDLLSDKIDDMMSAWNKLTRYKDFQKVVKGFFRALEITRNNDVNSKSFGTYHPHFHVVLAVPLSYGKHDYVKRDRWLAMWQKAMKDPSITQVDVRLARNKFSDSDLAAGAEISASLASAVAEIAKYAVKDSDFLFENDFDLTDSIVLTFAGALHHRRLVSFGGVFKEVFEELRLDDPEDGDLVHVNETINPALSLLIVRYGWSAGVYKITDSFVKLPEKGGE